MTSQTSRPLVILESPFRSGGSSRKKGLYKAFLAACVKDSLDRGEAPFASHGFYPQWLDDSDPVQRDKGIACGLTWGLKADLIAVYVNLGITHGMDLGRAYYAAAGIPIELRVLTEAQWPR